MGEFDGKVAVVSGAARGQGRSHAEALAQKGADVIALDICADIATNGYPLASPADLREARQLIESHGRKAVVAQVDVRDSAALNAAVAQGVEALGGLDVVVANAGIAPLRNPDPQAWIDAFNVDFCGAMNLISASYPHLSNGGSIVAIGSLAGFLPNSVANEASGPGGAGYAFAKRMIAALVHEMTVPLASVGVRINAVHPTNVDTDMLHSDVVYQSFRPDLPHPSRSDAEAGFRAMNALPVAYIEATDVTSAVLFLASDAARFITGTQLHVDAGGRAKYLPFHV